MIFFGGLSLIFCISFVSFISVQVSDTLKVAATDKLASIGRTIEHNIQSNLFERSREIQLLSTRELLTRNSSDITTVRQSLNRVLSSYKFYSWVGFADPQGKVVAAAQGVLEGADVSTRPWFIAGQKKMFVGDVHDAVLLAKVLATPNNEPLRLIDFSAPVFDRENKLLGVVATHANWKWVDNVIHDSLSETDVSNGVQVMIVEEDGKVLYPNQSDFSLPAQLSQYPANSMLRWPDQDEYLTTVIRLPEGAGNQLPWQIVMRQPISTALQAIQELHRQLILLSFVAALLCIWFIYRFSNSISRPLELLVSTVTDIQYGSDDVKFPDIKGIREFSFLKDAIYKMTMSLLIHEKELQVMNHTLEQKVQERTEELEQLNHELQSIARKDALTGLKNRRAASEDLEQVYGLYLRKPEPYAVIMLDVDFFKRVNDSYGHETGDIVLKQVSQILMHSVRSTDLIARYGGEEFLVLLHNVELEAARHIAEKIRQAVAEHQFVTVGNVTISCGVAMSSAAYQNAYDIVRHADASLYLAKTSGRNRVETHQN